MPRPPRIQGAGAFFHVTAKGNDERAIFVDDVDRTRFLQRLERLIARYEWRCHSYVLMTNHFHLLIELAEENLHLGMSELLGQHARFFNRRYGRSGHLFGKRYAAELVERESHFRETLRYIDMNPVRGGVCARPADWRWGSYRVYAGLDAAPSWLYVAAVIAAFGGGDRAAVRYADFVAQGEFAVGR